MGTTKSHRILRGVWGFLHFGETVRTNVITYSLALGLSLAACGDGDDGGADFDAAVGVPDAAGGADADVTPDAAIAVEIGPVTDFVAAAASPAGIALSWVNPTESTFDGVVIIAGEDVPVDFTPTDGAALTAGDAAGTGQTVIFAGNATDFDFLTTIPGLGYNFAAFAFDTDLAYSPVALTSGLNNALGTQTATLSVDLATQTVTVVSPSNLTITATAVLDDVADTLAIETTLQNDTGRLLFNLKGLSTAINQGTQAGNTFPIVGGEPSTYFGPESLIVGGQAVRTIDLSGIDGAVDPITVDLTFVDAPTIFGGNFGGDYAGIDSSGSTEGFAVDISNAGDNVRQIVITPDGRFIYAVGKNEVGLAIIDTSTNTSVAGADLSTAGIGSGGGVALSADGADLYIGYNDNAHYNGGDSNNGGQGSASADIHIIKMDAALAEQARLTLYTADAEGRTIKNIQISPDGSMLAAVVSSGSVDIDELFLVDIATFTLIDADAATGGDQPVVLSAVGFADHLTWSEDSATVFVGVNGDKNDAAPSIVSVVDAAAFTVSTLTPNTPGNSAGVMAAGNGKLYMPLRNGTGSVTIFDIAGATQVDGEIGTRNETNGVVMDPNGIHYYVIDDSRVMKYTAADDVRVDTDGDATNGVTDMTVGTDIRAHMLTISPF